MKKKSKSDAKKGLVSLVCSILLSGGSLSPLRAQDETQNLVAAPDGDAVATPEFRFQVDLAPSAEALLNDAASVDAVADAVQDSDAEDTESPETIPAAAVVPPDPSDVDAASSTSAPPVVVPDSMLLAAADSTDDPSSNSGSSASATPKPPQDPMDVDTANPPASGPAPKTAPDADMPEAENETPPQQPVSPAAAPPQPPVEIEPPLPNAVSTEVVAAGVPLAEYPDPAMERPFSEWDLAQVETPLFITNAINDFAERPLYLTGNWSVKPHLSIGCFYDGNIFVRSADTESDFITRVSPGITMRLGNDDSIFYMVADYTAGVDWYMEHSNESDVDQDGTASFQWRLPRLTLGLNVGVSSDTGTDIDATNRIRQHLYFVGVTSHYAYGEKTSFDLNADYSRSDFDGYISSSQIDASAFVNYSYSPKTQLGVGAAGGYVIVPGGSDQEYEEGNVRATYRATGKLTFLGEVGVETRQYASGGSDTVTPVFDASAAWEVRHGTEIALSLQRQIYVSALLQDQDYTATSVILTGQQRITDYVSVSLSLSYINSDYNSTTTGVSASREDNFFDIRPAVQWRATNWLSIGIFYEYSQNFSHGQAADPFERDRGGVDMAILF